MTLILNIAAWLLAAVAPLATATSMEGREWIGIKDLANELGIPVRTVYNWRTQGKGRAAIRSDDTFAFAAATSSSGSRRWPTTAPTKGLPDMATERPAAGGALRAKTLRGGSHSERTKRHRRNPIATAAAAAGMHGWLPA
jgi:hypothetical protein